MQEPNISINGVTLNESQSMTLRCALESFAGALNGNDLGGDALGIEIATGYRARISEIRKIMGVGA